MKETVESRVKPTSLVTFTDNFGSFFSPEILFLLESHGTNLNTGRKDVSPIRQEGLVTLGLKSRDERFILLWFDHVEGNQKNSRVGHVVCTIHRRVIFTKEKGLRASDFRTSHNMRYRSLKEIYVLTFKLPFESWTPNLGRPG